MSLHHNVIHTSIVDWLHGYELGSVGTSQSTSAVPSRLFLSEWLESEMGFVTWPHLKAIEKPIIVIIP